MADRFCGNCGNELRPDDRFCPNCGKSVHETAVVPTPEADVSVPPLPQQSAEATPPLAEQAEPPPASSSNNILEAFKRLSTTVKAILVIAAFVGVIAVANQDGSYLLLAVILLIVAGIAYVRPEEGSGATVTRTRVERTEPVSEAERSRLLDEAIG